jgi:hypothetical protein
MGLEPELAPREKKMNTPSGLRKELDREEALVTVYGR